MRLMLTAIMPEATREAAMRERRGAVLAMTLEVLRLYVFAFMVLSLGLSGPPGVPAREKKFGQNR